MFGLPCTSNPHSAGTNRCLGHNCQGFTRTERDILRVSNILDDSIATGFDPNVISIRVYQTTRSVGLEYSEPHPAHLTCHGALANRQRSGLQAHMTCAGSGSDPYLSGTCNC